MTERKIFVGGEWRATGDILEVRAPGGSAVVCRVHRAGPEQFEQAIAAAQGAFDRTRRLASFERSALLAAMAAGVRERREELVRILALEAGKPIQAGRVEVDRAAFTFDVAAEEARRVGGEILSLDWAPWGADRVGLIRRFPIGPIAAIVPFNFPLNLTAHKIAPCIAAGSTMVLKPASQTPSSALVLAEIGEKAGLTAGAFNVLPATPGDARSLVTDERFRMLTFTGSAEVGWDLKSRAGKKKVTLELGGNAAAIVHQDADLQWAAERITAGGYGYAGQSCISVQRALVQRSVLADFMDAFVARVRALRVGDPLDEATDVGPMIAEKEAERAESWIRQAAEDGAKIVVGGERDGATLAPTILADVRPEMPVSCREIFAPVVAVTAYDSLDEALAMANDSVYGLQAGIFTRDAPSIWKAFHTLEVGGLMVDDVPTFRIDHMPYGGVKDSGLGREGLRYAIEEMTETRIMGWHMGRSR